MIQASDPFKGVCRISREKFARILEQMANPAVTQERPGGQYWDVWMSYQIDPLFGLAMFNHESTMGKAGVAVQTHSWGNTRSPSFGAIPFGSVAGRTGSFPIWVNWLDGCKSTAARLATPDWVYSGTSRNAATGQTYGPRTQIQEIFLHPSEQVWAPAGDLNNPDGYLNAMLRFMNEHADQAGEPGQQPPKETRRLKLVVSAGHRNDSGGNAVERALTGELTEEIWRQAKAAGMDVYSITPDGPDPDPDPGDGHFSGTLSAVGQKVVQLNNTGQPVDVFCEMHFEGVGNQSVRGGFVIYPDAANDVDVDVRDGLGPLISRKLLEKTGIPQRRSTGLGIMSEKATGVGAQGFRLGIFASTESIKATCTRMIVEFGAHTSPDDLAIIKAPDFNSKAAAAFVEALLEFYNIQPHAKDSRFYPETGHFIAGGFKAFYDSVPDALMLFGYPISEEFTREDGITCQFFERACLEWQPELGWSWNAYHVMLSLVGRATYSGSIVPDASLGGGFKAFYEHYGEDALMLFGLPLTPEFKDERGVTVQVFERARFEWQPTLNWNWNPWHVMLALVGVEAAAAAREKYPEAFAPRQEDADAA